MFYQLKITRKGTKPPVWRRCTVAADVTFANMAAMLEKLVQYPAGSLYEIEFFQKKVQIRENGDGEAKNNFTLLNAGETETAELMDSEKWFTFRQYGADKEAPEYRVDIEKKDEGTAEAPSIIKEVRVRMIRTGQRHQSWDALQQLKLRWKQPKHRKTLLQQ